MEALPRVIRCNLNSDSYEIGSIELLGQELDRIHDIDQFEFWCRLEAGPMLGMLRNGEQAFLKYLCEERDAGFTSRAENASHGVWSCRLSNGQMGEYPLSWCLPVEQCYQVIAYFCANAGEKPEWVCWHED